MFLEKELGPHTFLTVGSLSSIVSFACFSGLPTCLHLKALESVGVYSARYAYGGTGLLQAPEYQLSAIPKYHTRARSLLQILVTARAHCAGV